MRAYPSTGLFRMSANCRHGSINDKLEDLLTSIGLKVGRQNYTYHSAGEVYSGQNLYAILQAPRGDATEALVLVAAWRTIADEFNRNGVSLALSLARYFKRMYRLPL